MKQILNDQDWYAAVANDKERNKYYEIFHSACNTYHINWATATPMEKTFIEAFTNHTFGRWKEKTSKEPVTIQPIFSI